MKFNDPVIINIAIAVVGIFSSWLITRKYYLKNLDDQRKEFQDTAKEYREIISKFADRKDKNSEINKKLLEENRIDRCIKKYTITGGRDFLRKMIDTYTDLSNEERANLLDTVLLRARGRKAKNNYYRQKDETKN